MGEYRKERLESLMRELLATEILKTIGGGDRMITVMNISVDEKYEKADVFVDVYPDEREEEVLRELSRNARQLQHALLKKMRIKRVPYLTFKAGEKGTA